MRLTQSNYFTIKNKYITNSKITDFIRDKNYFYRKHVLGEVEVRTTPNMELGKAIDCWLVGGSEKIFRERYLAVSRRNLQDPPQKIIELPLSQYKMVEKVCHRVEETTAYRQLRGYKTQKILKWDMPLGKYFLGIAGLLDFYKVFPEEKKAIIVDFKTTEDIDLRKYFYTCETYNYRRQLAMYKLLVMKNYPEVEKVECRHLAVSKDADEIYDVACFKFSDESIDEEIKNIHAVLEEIKKEEKFAIKDITWNDIQII